MFDLLFQLHQLSSQSHSNCSRRKNWLGSLKPAQAIQAEPARLVTSIHQPHPKLASKAVSLPVYFREGTHDGDGCHTLNVDRRDAIGSFSCHVAFHTMAEVYHALRQQKGNEMVG